VTKRADRLLKEIEAGALDSWMPIADLLRKVIALGGKAGSAELRDWAAQERNGYGPDGELPSYRQIAAPLHVDRMNMRWRVEGQPVGASGLRSGQDQQ
jgi:hypothetical protein